MLGVQKTSCLFLETKELSALGVRLTYNGDQPFFLHLVFGKTNMMLRTSLLEFHSVLRKKKVSLTFLMMKLTTYRS